MCFLLWIDVRCLLDGFVWGLGRGRGHVCDKWGDRICLLRLVFRCGMVRCEGWVGRRDGQCTRIRVMVIALHVCMYLQGFRSWEPCLYAHPERPAKEGMG